jgi:cell division protein FtsL
MNTVDATDARLTTHEAVCAQRYEKINETLEVGDKRMTKIEYLLYAVMAVVLLGPGVGAEFFKKLLGI